MKQLIRNLMENRLFLMLMNGVIGYTAMLAVIISVMQVPPEAILESGLDEVLLVFDEFPD